MHEWCGLGKGADFSGFCATCNKTRPLFLFSCDRTNSHKGSVCMVMVATVFVAHRAGISR
ncbi:hypothetical protein CHUV0807_2535 [Cardiobacterium hominis]|uniref:Uncharacterized protein n=1 Tax=Cardiobacterium hominis TaxID=2718 RepID=A0A1C3H7E4_9GAMM|nr:hypothetical protein CHUV0807_2535 [Cardiobacterium hominis]